MDLEEAKLMLNQKVDNNTFQKMINSKSSSIETNNIKITLTNLTEEIKNKISIEKFDSFACITCTRYLVSILGCQMFFEI